VGPVKLFALAVAVTLASCATAPSVCRGFDARDFRRASVGVAANGDLLSYNQPSLACR